MSDQVLTRCKPRTHQLEIKCKNNADQALCYAEPTAMPVLRTTSPLNVRVWT